MIEDYIPVGRDNRISSKSLAQILGYKSVRDLQMAIESRRGHGGVILSTCKDGGGYWLPDETELHEVRKFIHTLESRAQSTLAAVESAKSYLTEHESGW